SRRRARRATSRRARHSTNPHPRAPIAAPPPCVSSGASLPSSASLSPSCSTLRLSRTTLGPHPWQPSRTPPGCCHEHAALPAASRNDAAAVHGLVCPYRDRHCLDRPHRQPARRRPRRKTWLRTSQPNSKIAKTLSLASPPCAKYPESPLSLTAGSFNKRF